MDYIECDYYNLFENTDTHERVAIPVCRRGNPSWAIKQSFKKADLSKILKKKQISETRPDGIYSHLLFLTLTIDQKQMSSAQANHYITTKGQGLNRFFARFNKVLDKGYSKVSVKESTVSGYPAVHVLLFLETPLKIKWHDKSNTFRPDPSNHYTKKVLGCLKNLNDWNSVSPCWGVGFIDIYAFTNDRMSFRGYANPVNYIAKYLSKSLNVNKIPELKTCKKVSELPVKYRTAVWTILNNLIWNSQTWVISKAFRKALNALKTIRDKLKGNWVRVNTVSVLDPRLYIFMGYSVEETNKILHPPLSTI